MIRVMIVSRHPVFREGIRVILEDDGDVEVIGSALDLYDTGALRAADDGGVLLSDLDNPTDIQQVSDFCARPGRRICLFVQDLPAEYMFRLRELGVSGIVSTRSSKTELIEALRSVAEGQLFFDPLLPVDAIQTASVHLSPRESQLVELLTRGLKNKELASHLNVTEGTVKVYLSKLFQKVGAKDRFDLALCGLKNFGSVQPRDETGSGHPCRGKAEALSSLVTRSMPQTAGEERSPRRFQSR